jgi:hypothetical protein
MLSVPFRKNGLRLCVLVVLVCSVTGQTTLNSFNMSQYDRVAGKASAAATFTFTPTAGGALVAGGLITLNYPTGFFVSGTTPISAAAQGATFNAATSGTRYINVMVATGAVAASSPITVTLTGFTMGAATAGGDVTVQTSVDVIKSGVQASGVIGGQPSLSLFAVAASDRVAGKASAAATFSFTTTAGGALATSSTITLTYPSGFFTTAEGTLGVLISGGATGTMVAPTATQIVITITGGTIAVSTAVTVTVTGRTMGSATAGGSIFIATSADQTASAGVSSGVIGGQPTLPSFTIATGDRVAGKASAAATFSFTTTAGGALATSSTITLNYPTGFFVSGTNPISAAAQGATFNAATSGDSSIALTVATGVVAASSPITVTLTGFTMGAATAGGSVTVQTSVDVIESGVQASGFIGGFVSFTSFGIDDRDRDANKSKVAVSFSFAPSAGGELSEVGQSQITLVYPRGFFSSGVTPGVILNGATAISSASGVSSIVITLESGSIAASSNVVVTLTRMTMGADGTPGDIVNCTTTRDLLPSVSRPSGILRCSSPPGKYCPQQLAANQDCPAEYYCPSATMKEGILCPKGAYCERGKSMYQNCAPGKYCPEGSSSGTDCPVGTYNPEKSSTAESACLSCKAGTFNALVGQTTDEACGICPDNYYSSQGKSECTPCEGGGISTFTKQDVLAESQESCIPVGWLNFGIGFGSLVCFFVSLCFYCLYLDRKHPGSSHLPIFFAFMSLTEIAGFIWVLSDTWRLVIGASGLVTHVWSLPWRYPGTQAVVVGLSSIYGISYLYNFLKSLSWAKKVRHALQAHAPSCTSPTLLRRKNSVTLILNAGMNALRACGYYSSCAWRALRTFCSAAATLAVGFSSRPLWTPRFRKS